MSPWHDTIHAVSAGNWGRRVGTLASGPRPGAALWWQSLAPESQVAICFPVSSARSKRSFHQMGLLALFLFQGHIEYFLVSLCRTLCLEGHQGAWCKPTSPLLKQGVNPMGVRICLRWQLPLCSHTSIPGATGRHFIGGKDKMWKWNPSKQGVLPRPSSQSLCFCFL